jgi:hypothetical protein
MSTLLAILEFQGCLDTAVIKTQDPRVMEAADAFLPGTSANTQWYREIEAFMFPRGRPGDNEPRVDANPVRAMTELQTWWNEGKRRPTPPEASRLIYGVGAVVHLLRTVPMDPMPFPDPLEQGNNRNLLLQTFALTAGEDPAPENALRLYEERFDPIVDLFATEFNGWKDWYKVARTLATDHFKVLTAQAASVPMCLPSVVTVDGIESVVVDTELSSDYVSLNALKAVVDPRNWAKDYPSFFCEMQDKGTRLDHWRKVLEYVGFCNFDDHISPRLRTMLKFYKTTVNGPDRYEARLDYDLNDPVLIPPGDGKITVDRGFINMWSTKNDPTKKGVAVRTRKVAHIEGLRPYTMKRFVCAFGYGFAVAEMLFGSAANYKGGDTDYTPWEDPATETPEQGSQASQVQGSGTAPEPHPENSVASTAISMVAKCVQDLSVKQFDLADKWLAGQLTVEDLAQHTAEVGARIASDPWKFIQAISQSKPKGS